MPIRKPKWARRKPKPKLPFRRKKVPKPVKKYVKRQFAIQSPIRQYKTTQATNEIIATWQWIDVTQMAMAGAGVADDIKLFRDTDDCHPLTLEIQGQVDQKYTGVIDSINRVMVFRWPLDINIVVPTETLIFGANPAPYYKYYAKTNNEIDAQHIQVLYDRIFHFGPALSAVAPPISYTAGPKSRKFSPVFNLRKLPKITYITGDGNTGKNHIYVAWVGNSATGGNTSTIAFRAALKYR